MCDTAVLRLRVLRIYAILIVLFFSYVFCFAAFGPAVITGLVPSSPRVQQSTARRFFVECCCRLNQALALSASQVEHSFFSSLIILRRTGEKQHYSHTTSCVNLIELRSQSSVSWMECPSVPDSDSIINELSLPVVPIITLS